jgi:hypothetical protein
VWRNKDLRIGGIDMLITDISKCTSSKGMKTTICYIKGENGGIESEYKVSSYEIPRPEMGNAWHEIDKAFQRVHPGYDEAEEWVLFYFNKVAIKYVSDMDGKIEIKSFKLTGIMNWDYMGFQNIATGQIYAKLNEELTAAIKKLVDESERYIKGQRAQMSIFKDDEGKKEGNDND